MLRCISLHHYMLMFINWCCALCLWTINQIHFWGKPPFQQVAWWTTSFIFLILMLAAAQQVFKKKKKKHGPCKVPCTWCSGSATALSLMSKQFSTCTILAKSLWGNVDSCNQKQNSPDKWYAMQVSLSISWQRLNTFSSIRFKFDSKLS